MADHAPNYEKGTTDHIGFEWPGPARGNALNFGTGGRWLGPTRGGKSRVLKHTSRQIRAHSLSLEGIMFAMGQGMQLEKFDGVYTLSFECRTPVDDVVLASGDEPNGHFWETVAAFIAPSFIGKLELDSEGSLFSASGKRRHLRRLQRLLQPVTADPQRLRAVLVRAEQQGFPIEG